MPAVGGALVLAVQHMLHVSHRYAEGRVDKRSSVRVPTGTPQRTRRPLQPGPHSALIVLWSATNDVSHRLLRTNIKRQLLADRARESKQTLVENAVV